MISPRSKENNGMDLENLTVLHNASNRGAIAACAVWGHKEATLNWTLL